MQKRLSLLCTPAILLLTLLLAGCRGGNQPESHHLAGAITFAGKPVPAGTIVFTPDVKKGNRGPAGFAIIREGKFDTRLDGKGTIGGPHEVRISGIKDAVLPDSDAPVKLLFPEYTTNLDIPKQDATHDFEVPSSSR